MQLTEDELREFVEIWKDEFNEPITIEDARQSASALLDLYLILTSSWSSDEPKSHF